MKNDIIRLFRMAIRDLETQKEDAEVEESEAYYGSEFFYAAQGEQAALSSAITVLHNLEAEILDMELRKDRV